MSEPIAIPSMLHALRIIADGEATVRISPGQAMDGANTIKVKIVSNNPRNCAPKEFLVSPDQVAELAPQLQDCFDDVLNDFVKYHTDEWDIADWL